MDVSGSFRVSMERLQGGQPGANFVHIDRLWGPILVDGSRKAALHCSLIAIGSQQKVDGPARVAQGQILVLPLLFCPIFPPRASEIFSAQFYISSLMRQNRYFYCALIYGLDIFVVPPGISRAFCRALIP